MNSEEYLKIENKLNQVIMMMDMITPSQFALSQISDMTGKTFNFDNQHYKDSLASGPLLVDPLMIAATNSQQIIQRYAYTFELFKLYDPTDKRRDATFMTITE